MKIVFCSPDSHPQPWVDRLAAALPGAEVWAWSPYDIARQADYAVVWSPPAALFDTQKKLKAVFNIGAGVDGVLRVATLPSDLPVIRLNDAGMAVQMAEYVCHALIRHARQFDVYERQAGKQLWNKLREIDRATFPVGVMGLGDIGMRVAQSVAGFGYPTFGWSRSPRKLAGVTTYAGPEFLESFLRSVRVLVCVLPLTPDTEGILNERTLSMLQPNAYLINVARGKLLAEHDLIGLLERGVLAGAALDVFREEPLPANHAFWRQPKITITPHISALTLREESIDQIAGKIRALERGQSITGVVQTQRGY
jgi:glyoxylate/hydroxypyruvate reductase A